jgi:hypothetical protein
VRPCPRTRSWSTRLRRGKDGLHRNGRSRRATCCRFGHYCRWRRRVRCDLTDAVRPSDGRTMGDGEESIPHVNSVGGQSNERGEKRVQLRFGRRLLDIDEDLMEHVDQVSARSIQIVLRFAVEEQVQLATHFHRAPISLHCAQQRLVQSASCKRQSRPSSHSHDRRGTYYR